MTNEELRNKIESYRFGTQALSDEEMDFIDKNYRKGNSKNRFYKVYRRGFDAKYGHIMVDPIDMVWRGSTFEEFYGGGVVD